MADLQEKRILLMTGNSRFVEDFAGIEASGRPPDASAARSASMLAWEPVSSTLSDLVIETVDNLASAEIAIRRALKERRPYYLAVIDLDTDSALDDLAACGRVRCLDASLIVIFCSENPVSAREAVATTMGTLDGHFLLPKPLNLTDTRQLVASQLDRRLTRDRMLLGDKELHSIRRRLDRATRTAEEAERFKAQFIANVSHEIRTPMNAILGFSRLLMKEGLSEEQKEKVCYVHNAGNALSRLIDNMLDFSKLAEGKLKLCSRDFDPNAVLRDVLDATRPAAREKGLSMHCHFQQSIPRRLRGDSVRFGQILTQLINNAIKFTELGSIHVHVALDEELDSSVILRTVVTDTGAGIPLDRHDIVFESFAQADGSATRSFEGLGLGLTICKRLADLMGGQIGFRSTPDEGSSFWFTTVFLKQDPQESSSDGQAPSASAASLSVDSSCCEPGDDSPAGSAKFRLLAADDNPIERMLIEAMLTRAGCIVDLVVDGKEALTALMNNRYDLVLIDIQMPRMDGREVLRHFRREEAASGRHPVVIAISAGCTDDEREECLRAGADEFLVKPFTPEELFQMIGGLFPEFLESLGETSLHQDAASDGKKEQLEMLPTCMAALRSALDGGNFGHLENQVRTIRASAARAGSKVLADHAMRIELAARAEDSQRTLAAIDRFEQHLRYATDPEELPETLLQPCP